VTVTIHFDLQAPQSVFNTTAHMFRLNMVQLFHSEAGGRYSAVIADVKLWPKKLNNQKLC
jgi:hypothetical protein